MSELERATQSSRDQLKQALIRAAVLTPEQERDPERIRLLFEYGDLSAEPSHPTAGAFDFGDRSYFERGLKVYRELFKRRYVRSHPVNAWTTKSLVGSAPS